MSAPACVVYYGLRFDVSPEQLEALELKSDERLLAAKRVGLNAYWGNFANDGEDFLIFVGAQVGVFGDEGQTELEQSDGEFDAIRVSVHEKLALAGFAGTPALYIQWHYDL